MIKRTFLLLLVVFVLAALPTAAQDNPPLPRAGGWTLTFDEVTYASCRNMATIALDSADLFPTLELPARIATRGGTLRVNGSAFEWTADNEYVGILRWNEEDNVQLFLQVASPTRMTGRLVLTFLAAGYECSSTTPIVITRN